MAVDYYGLLKDFSDFKDAQSFLTIHHSLFTMPTLAVGIPTPIR